jgi:hypothetical protein
MAMVVVNKNNTYMDTDFNDLHWHDSVIKRIEIDRNNPGSTDTILLEIAWYNNGVNKIIFEDVYWSKLDMNFGIVAPEQIDYAYIVDESDKSLTDLYNRWGGLINNIKLSCYLIKTISTGSEIRIIAKGYKILATG